MRKAARAIKAEVVERAGALRRLSPRRFEV